jgi:hypothetical protein
MLPLMVTTSAQSHTHGRLTIKPVPQRVKISSMMARDTSWQSPEVLPYARCVQRSRRAADSAISSCNGEHSGTTSN